MASSKHYAYYIRGSQLAIIEHDISSGDGLNYVTAGDDVNDINDIGPSGSSLWKSPTEAIADGIEIEYAYSPRYSVSLGKRIIDTNQFYLNGWTVMSQSDLSGTGSEKGYLTFLRGQENDVVNWNSSPESDALSADEYIVIRGSSRWNGLHKVRSISNDGGMLMTWTEVKGIGVPQLTSGQIDFAVDETIFDGGAGTVYLADMFSTDDYVWVAGSQTGKNNGLFSISSVTQSNTAASSKITLGTRYSVVNSSDSDSYATGLTNEYSAASSITGETNQTDIGVFKAYRDFCYLLTDVDVLNDESDTIDLPEYLAKALVYYVKAKLAEDQMDLEAKEYLMREFRRILEKHESSKVWGARQLGVGPHGIR